MKYRYKWYQIFNEKLKVPKRIESQVYSNHLSLIDYITYELYGKVPLTCLKEKDRKILDKFGLEKILNLDWELILTPLGHTVNIDYINILDKIPNTEEKINEVLYELLIEIIPPEKYSKKMKELFTDRYCKIEKKDNETQEEYDLRYIKMKYNDGKIPLEAIVENWAIFKEKRFTYHLNNDTQNSYGLTEQDIREFMNKNELIAKLVSKHNDIYKFIYEYNTLKNQTQKREFIKKFTDNLLERTKSENVRTWEVLQFTNEEYKAIFTYSSLEEYLKNTNEYYAELLIKELHDLSPDYIFTTQFPFELFQSSNIIGFVALYGLQNTCEFDKECGNFFSNNNFYMLKNMYEMYIHYSHNAKDEYKFYIPNGKKENEVYTKDSFYEIIRRMLLNGPTNADYSKHAPYYGDMKGEFRNRFSDMFIDENVPEELEKAFYTKNITPSLLKKYSNYIEALRGKKIGACFKREYVRQKNENGWLIHIGLYESLEKNLSFEEAIEYIFEYSDLLEIYSNMDYYERKSEVELIYEK